MGMRRREHMVWEKVSRRRCDFYLQPRTSFYVRFSVETNCRLGQGLRGAENRNRTMAYYGNVGVRLSQLTPFMTRISE
jgi:hypothetical protein